MLRAWSFERLVVRASTLTAWVAVALLALAGTTSCGTTPAVSAASSGTTPSGATAGPPTKTSTSQLACSLHGYGYDNPSALVTLDVTISTPARARAAKAVTVRMSTTAAALPPAVISQLTGRTRRTDQADGSRRSREKSHGGSRPGVPCERKWKYGGLSGQMTWAAWAGR